MKKSTLVLFVVAALAVAVFAAPVYAAEVRLHGATTTIDRLINPYKDAVEKQTGHKLELVGNDE